MGIDGEAIEVEWKHFAGFSSLSILAEFQQDLEKRKIQPEEFTDRIIFMSMFKGIVWNTNDESCGSNAEKVKNYAMRFSKGHWARKRSGEEVLTTLRKGNGIVQPPKWCNGSKKLVVLYSKVSVP